MLSKKELFDVLNTSENGLNDFEVSERLKKFGLNTIEKEEKFKAVKIFLRQFEDPFVILLLVAALFSLFVFKEFLDFLSILIILLFNALLGFFQEYKAEKVVEKLKKYITYKVKVRREGKIEEIDSKYLVPGDIIILEEGVKVPADIRIIKIQKTLQIDESILTGESYPVEKISRPIRKEKLEIFEMKNMAFMGTFVVKGYGEGVVVETGKNTYFGKIAKKLQTKVRKSLFIENLQIFSRKLFETLGIIAIFFLVLMIFIKGYSIIDAILFVIAFLVGVVPEGLPAVSAITFSKGADRLAKKKVVVKRLAAIEELGDINLLCVDKTGTITKNKLELEGLWNYSDKDIVEMAIKASSIKISKGKIIAEPLEKAIAEYYAKYNSFRKLEELLEDIEDNFVSMVPFDSETKMMRCSYREGKSVVTYLKGAPEVILNLCNKIDFKGNVVDIKDFREKIERDLEKLLRRGYRVIGVAYSKKRDKIFVGFLAFLDPPKKDARIAVKLAKKHGIDIRIITGDHPLTALEIARRVGLDVRENEVIEGKDLRRLSWERFKEEVKKIKIFARVNPEDKANIVKAFKEMGYKVAVTGDGVNDAPALKEAYVGISFKKAADITREVADIILLENNLKVMVNGIIEGRKIFANLTKYLVYTLSGNIGDVFAISILLLFLKFIPLLPKQILLLNLLSDGPPAISIAYDNVPKNFLKEPNKWNVKGLIKKILIYSSADGFIGPILAYLLVHFNFDMVTIRSAYFVQMLLAEIVLLFVTRTDKLIIKEKCKPCKELLISGILFAFIGIFCVFSWIGRFLGFKPFNLFVASLVIFIVSLKFLAYELSKLIFIKKSQ